jgi:hypothetical protein
VSNTKVVPLRFPEHLDDLAASSAQEEHTDKATALRRWLHIGATQFVLGLVGEGRISASRGAELLQVSVFDLYREAAKLGIELGATDQQRAEGWQQAQKLVELSRAGKSSLT